MPTTRCPSRERGQQTDFSLEVLAASSCSVQTFEGKPFFCEMLGFFLTAYLHGMLSFLQMNKLTNQPEEISVACN